MPAYKNENAKKNKWCTSFYYTDWQGKRRHKTKRGFARKADADAFERDFLARLSKSPEIPFSAVVDNYFQTVAARELRITTYSRKLERIRMHILPYFGNRPINSIEPLDIVDWQENVIMSGKSRGGYSESYLRILNGDLSSIFNYAVTYYKLTNNPCRAAKMMGSSSADKKMNIWTPEEFKKFRSVLPDKTSIVAFDILFWTGCREGELLALTPSDILPEPSIQISKNYARLGKEDYTLPTKTKKGNRVVAIPNFLYNEIMEYVNSVYGLEKTDRIFPFTRDFLARKIRKYSKKAGITQIRIHDLRHSHASMLIEMGYNILTIAERLGHKSVDTTWNTYGHLYPGKDRSLADSLEGVKNDRKTIF